MWIVILLLISLLLYGVWRLLRGIYIKPIFSKIDTADGHLLAITMNSIRVESDDYRAKIVRYEERYKVLKELNEYLLNSKCWIQDYLMTAEEKERYTRAFKRFLEAEKELLLYYLYDYTERKGDNEIIHSDWFNKWYTRTV